MCQSSLRPARRLFRMLTSLSEARDSEIHQTFKGPHKAGEGAEAEEEDEDEVEKDEEEEAVWGPLLVF